MKQLNKFTHKSWTDWNLGPNLLQINMFTFCMSYDSDPSQQDPVWWLQYTNTHGLQKSCGEKGMAWPLSKWERARELERAQERELTPAWTGLYCFSGHITSRMVLVYYAQVHYRWLPFKDNKGQNTANYFKEKDVTAQGGNCSHSILGWFSSDFRKIKILSKHLLPQGEGVLARASLIAV